jgi:hypothetical protein
MLSETLTIDGQIFTKDSDNTAQGTLFSSGSGFATKYITVRHTKPAPGKSGTVRSLWQLSYPLNDPLAATPTATSGRITVNFTVTYPFGAEDTAITAATRMLSSFLSGTAEPALGAEVTKFIDGQA